MEKPEKIEQFLLTSLIEDLEIDLKRLDSSDFEESKTATCTPKSFFPESETLKKAIDDTQYISYSSSPILKEEVLLSLENQKATLVLQGKVRHLKPDELSLVLFELQGIITTLMKDKNGNYFCNDLFKSCKPNQRIAIMKEISQEILDISCNKFGTHPIQTLIECAKTKNEVETLMSILSKEDTIMKLAYNSNGSYVIQKVFSHIPDNQRLVFNKIIYDNLLYLSLDVYGICIVKKYLLQSIDYLIISIGLFIKHFIQIAENQYGNYLMQFILETYWNRPELIQLKQVIWNSFVRLSCNKYAFHISEIYISLLSQMEKKMLLSGLIRTNSCHFLLRSKWGINVINKIIKVNRDNYCNNSRNSNNVLSCDITLLKNKK